MGCTASDGIHVTGGEIEPQLDYYLTRNTTKEVSANKPDSNFIETSEVTQEQFAATKPWLGSLKPPSQVFTVDSSVPSINLTLSFVNGYKVDDARSVIYYGESDSTIIYPAAAVGIVMNTKSLEQRFMGAGNTKTANGHVDDITCLALNSNKKLAVTGSLGKQPLLLLWDTQTLQVKARTKLARNTISISCVKFSRNGQYVFCTDKSNDANIYCYKSSNLTLLAQSKCGQVAIDMAVSDDNTVGIATAQGVCFFKFQQNQFKKNKGLFLQNKRQGMISITYSPQHKTFITGSMIDGTFYFWQKNSCSKTKKMHDGSVMSLVLVGENFYSSGGKDKVLKVSNYDCEIIKTFILPSYAKSIDASKDKIIIGTKDGSIIQFNGDKKTQLISGHSQGQTWGLAVGKDTVYSSGDDNKIIAFNVKTKRIQQQTTINDVADKKTKIKGNVASSLSLTSPNQQSRALALNKKGHLAVGINDGTLSIRTANNLKNQIFKSNDSKQWIEILKYNPQQNLLAVGSHDNNIYIYSIDEENYSLKGVLKGHNSFITGVDWSEDGNNIKSVCGAYELLFWDVEKLEQVKNGATLFRDTKWANSSGKIGWDVQGIFPPSTDGTHINKVERSSDGKLIVTGDDWGFINVFRCPCLKGGQALSFRGHSSHIMGVQFDQSNQYLYSVGGYDKTLMVWKVSS